MDLQQLDRRTRKLLYMHGVHHPAAAVDRLYAPCTEGGRGLDRSSRRISLVLWGWTVAFVTALISSCKWYRGVMLGGPPIQSNAWPVSLLHSCRRVSLNTAQLQDSLSKYYKSQSLHGSGTILCDSVFEQAPQTDAKHFHTCSSSLCVQSWRRKPMHGQYCRLTEKPPVDMKETYRWPKSSNLPAATEKLVVAAQDQAFRTRYHMSATFCIEMSVPLAACAV